MKTIFLVSLALGVLTAAQSQTIHRAVLIDGFKSGECSDQGGDKAMAALGAMLKNKGYAVFQFAAPIQSFPAIRDALNGAEIVVYWGHGVIRNSRSCFAPESADVGGFSIDGRDISPDDLRREVRLAPNAIVLLPCSCYAAGNASMDAGKVRREVLEARMRNYALPFTQIGARGVGACLDARGFLAAILAGKAFNEAYESTAWRGKTVTQLVGAYEFRYRESNGKEGLSTNSALFWKVSP